VINLECSGADIFCNWKLEQSESSLRAQQGFLSNFTHSANMQAEFLIKHV